MGTFMHSSRLTFCDRYNQHIVFSIDKPVRSLIVIRPNSYLAIKCKHFLNWKNEKPSLSILKLISSTNHGLDIDVLKRKNRESTNLNHSKLRRRSRRKSRDLELRC